MHMLEPAHSIIRKLGGPNAVSRAIGVHRTRISNWSRPKEKGGTGGIIPHWHIPKLMRYARDHNIPLTVYEFAPRLEDNGEAA